MKWFGRIIMSFLRDLRGNFATGFAIVVSLMVFMAAGAIEVAQIYNVKSSLQAAVDAAALAAAREISVTGTAAKNADATVANVVEDVFGANIGASIVDAGTITKAEYDRKQGLVTVNATLDTTVPPLVRYALKVDKIEAESQAQIVGRPNICVIALESSGDRAVHARNKAVLIGRNCAVYSNSSSPKGVEAESTSAVSATFTCSHGGAAGPLSSYKPEPITDCPKIVDPLKDRPAPAIASAECDFTDMKVQASATLNPGVYCGGLKINSQGKVYLNPGIYVMRDGPLDAAGKTELIGSGVGFYLTGPGAVVLLEGNSIINLEAPTSGEMAGILFADSRTQSVSNTHKITSNRAERLVGALYFPNTELEVDAPGTVADKSPWTAIIAREVRMLNDSNVVLNTNYGDTNVPVPDGIGGEQTPVRLAR